MTAEALTADVSELVTIVTVAVLVRWQLKSSREWPGAVSVGSKENRDDKERWKDRESGRSHKVKTCPVPVAHSCNPSYS
jgi:hypothetical protein